MVINMVLGSNLRSGGIICFCIIFQVKFFDRQEGLMVSSVIYDHWWHLKIVVLKCHQGTIKDNNAQLKILLCRPLPHSGLG